MIFIGIDSGTQSTKTVALDLESGKILATAQHGYELISGLAPGHLEQEPQDWVDATRTGLEEVVAQLGARASEVKGIGVSGQQHGLVPLDAEGNPVRAAKLWCDTSTIAQCDAFAAAFGGQDGLIAKAGNGIMAGYTIPKLLWLKENEPENFAKTRHVLLPHDYLNYWLTGQMTMEFGDASGTGVLNVRTREWDSELLGFVDPAAADLFPEVGSSRKPGGDGAE